MSKAFIARCCEFHSPETRKIFDLYNLPTSRGTYALLLHLPREKKLRVGRFGTFRFPQGDYVYVGSAFGPGGLRARLARHLRQNKVAHWHIDSLRAHADVRAITFTTAPYGLECVWSQRLSSWRGTRIPVAKFGARDCVENCPAHLIAFPRGISARTLRKLLEHTDAPVRLCALD